jgi:hypothetical protein
VALALYDDAYWFPDGTLARNIPARVFPEHSNTFAPLYADQAGTQPLPNPLNTDNDGRLRFWVEAGIYWISIDQESIRVPIGTGEEGVTPQQLDAAIAVHNADTTHVHGIPDTSQLLTQGDLPDLSGYATDAELAAHTTATTDVHGIVDTATLETQAGAQAKADAAEAAAEAAASADATAKVNTARGELQEQITAGDEAGAAALAAHAAETTNVHGIPDTAAIPTNAQFEQVQAALTAHEADTTAVHGIADTAALATDADVAVVADGLAAHVADTTGVHGIANTEELLTQQDLDAYATDADLAAHAADTTAVHGIADTAALATQADLAGLATDADVTAVQNNLDAHAADTTAVHGIADTAALLTQGDLDGLVGQAEFDAHTDATTNVHGIPDTAALLTQQDLDQYATDTELAAHVNDTTAVHGIPDTAALETQAGAQAKADAAQTTAIDMASGLVTEHAADTTAVHGIADTAVLETQSGAQAKADAAEDSATAAASAALNMHEADTTNVHGIADTAALETISGAAAKYPTFADAAIPPTRKTPAWRRPTTSFQFQAGHDWTVSGAASSNLNNTASPVRGKQYASITTDTAGNSANLRRYGGAPMDLTGKAVRIICRISDVTKVANINFFAGVSNMGTNFRWRLWQVAGTSQLGSSGEWITLTFGWADVNAAAGSFTLSSQGVPSTTTGFTDLLVQAIAVNGQSFTLDVQAVEFIEAASATFPNGVCSVVFDDGADSIWSLARPAMDEYQFSGTNYVIVQSLGTPGVMTTSQNQALQNFSGWEVGLHAYSTTVHDARYTSYTAAQVDADIRAGKAWLARNGFAGESMAYPGGEYQKTSDGVGIDSIASRYFSTGRTILHQSGFPTESFPAGMPMRMRAVSSISSLQSGANNPANLVASGGLLDRCQLSGGWLVLVFHKITVGAPTVSTECSEADFKLIMAGINSRGIPVVPVSDVMHLYS